MINRRKEDRLRERNKVTIRAPHSVNGNKETNAYTYDISVGGARIFSKEFYDVGTFVRIQIELARTKQNLSVVGEVKWYQLLEDEDLFEIGIEFQHQISHSIVALIRHLYGSDAGIPSSIS